MSCLKECLIPGFAAGNRLGFLPLGVHRVGHAENIPLVVAEVEVRNAQTVRIAVGPEGVEFLVGVERPAGIAVVARAVVGQRADTLPRESLVAAAPHHHFAARAPVLGTGVGRRDDGPHVVAVDPEAAAVVAVRRGGDLAVNPFAAVPADGVPPADAAVGTRQVVVARQVEDHGLSVRAEIDVLDVTVALFGAVVVHEGGVFRTGYGQFHGFAVDRSPRPAPVLRLDVIDIGAGVHVAVDVAVETAHQLVAAEVGELVVARFGLALVDDRGDLPVAGPFAAVGAGLAEQLPYPVITGEEEEKSLFGVVVHLRVGHDALVDVFEFRDVVGLRAAVADAGTLVGASGDEHPNVSVAVDLDRGVVVGVADAVHALVENHDRTAQHPGLMVVAARHAEQVFPVFGGRAAVDEEGLVGLGRVDRHRDVLHRVGSQAARVFGPVGRTGLADREPDAAVSVGLPVVHRRVFLRSRGPHREQECQ